MRILKLPKAIQEWALWRHVLSTVRHLLIIEKVGTRSRTMQVSTIANQRMSKSKADIPRVFGTVFTNMVILLDMTQIRRV